MGPWVRRLTLDAWRAIDAEFMDRPVSHWRVAAVLVFAVVCLILPRYFGRPDILPTLPGVRAWLQHAPYPSLWPRLYWGAFKAINYLLLPMAFIRWVLREQIADFGFKVSRDRATWALYAGMLAVVLPLTFLASLDPTFGRTYPKYREAGETVTQLLSWEGIYAFQFFALEFFFRGFLLFALARHLGSSAIFVAIVPYAMIHFSKPLPETLGSIIAGIALGTLALRTRSIYGGVLVHCAVAWSMDLFVLFHRGQLPWRS